MSRLNLALAATLLGTCDASADDNVGDPSMGIYIALVMASIFVVCVTLCKLCERANRKAPESPEGAGDYVGSLHWTGTIHCFCISCAGDTDRALPPYSFTPAEEWCYSTDPKGMPAQCCLPNAAVGGHLARALHSLSFSGGIPFALSVNSLAPYLSHVVQVRSGRQHGPS